MAFLGDLIVKIGANANPFTAALKKAQSMTQTFKAALTDMRMTAGVFSKLAASIKAVNNQMDRLIHVSKLALSAVNNQATAENHQFKLRMQQLKMIADAQRRANPQSDSGGLIGAGIAGGIAGSITSGVSGMMSAGAGAVADLGVGIIKLAAGAEQMQMQFSVLLGSAEKGQQMFKSIEHFAARTSFDLISAADATTRLLATGVAEKDVIGTLQLIGDLSLGDANKLQFLSKAYTDVMNKGKLQAQETKQFSENGIGLMAALSASTGKSVTELTSLQEQGAISFQMVQKALIGLTTGQGRFANGMEKMNLTLLGQWNSLIENIQSFGRDLGALVMPALKNIVEEMNKFVQGFRGVADKAEVIGDVLNAAADVAIEYFRENWAKLMDEMITMSFQAGQQIMTNLNPVNAVGKFIGGAIGRSVAGGGAAEGQTPLQAAMARFEGVMNNIKAQAPVAGPVAPLLDLQPGADGSKLKMLAGDLAEGATSLFERASVAASAKMTDLKIKGGFLGSVLGNMFGVGGDKAKDDKSKATKQETRFAGAMQKGSAEAYSTIVQAMFRGKDPNVQATEKQTTQLVKAIKETKPKQAKFLPEFA